MSKTVADIARMLGAELVGDGDRVITGVNGIEEARAGELSFIASEKFLPLLDTAKASCVIVPSAITSASVPIIRAQDPQGAFLTVLEKVFPYRIPGPSGIHASAVIDTGAKLAKDVAVGAYAVVERSVTVGAGTVIYPFCYIGHGTVIGKECVIYPHVTVRERTTIGDRVIIHPGVVIGADGFGYIMREGSHRKIPQTGTILIADDVEIGANTTIDRATLSRTVIGKGTKIDNLVQIAHNVTIGKHCILAAQTGISGSCTIGDYCILAGQVGVADHITLKERTIVKAQAGVTKNFPAASSLSGMPARSDRETNKALAAARHAQKLHERVLALERKVRELTKT